MTNLSEYIEDYLKGDKIPDHILKQFQERLENDPTFKEEVEQYRQTIEALKLHGIKKRITEQSQISDTVARAHGFFKWVVLFLILIIAGIVVVVIINRNQTKKQKIENPISEPSKTVLTAPLDSNETEDSILMADENFDSENRNKESQVAIEEKIKRSKENVHEDHNLVMAYVEKKLPITSGTRGDNESSTSTSLEQLLASCIRLIENKQFREASTCLKNDFGDREEDADWFRALNILALQGKDATKSQVKRIANDRLHLYHRQAKQLLAEL